MSANDVLTRLQNAPAYHPSSVELLDDMTLQAGDVVQVKAGQTAYNLPIYSQTLHWDGMATTMIESTGNEKRKGLPALRRKEYSQSAATYQQGQSLGRSIGGVSSRVTAMENSAVIQNSDSIALVAGKFVIDQQGNVHVIDGSGLYLGEGGASLAVYTDNNLTAGVIVNKIVTDTTTTTQTAMGTYINNQLDAGVMVTKITGDSSGSSIGVKLGTFVDDYLDAGVIVSKVTGSTTVSMGTYINNQLDAGVMVQKINADGTAKASLGFYDNGTLTAGVIVDKINGGTVTIQAAKVDLGNYATVGALETVDGKITKLTTAQTRATSLDTYGLTVRSDLSLLGYGVEWGLCSVGSKTFNYLAKSGDSPTITYADLPHYHTVTFSNGQFSIGGVTNTAPAPFDVTATTWYTNQIAAAKNSVHVVKSWEENICTCIPSAGTGTGATITISQTTGTPTAVAPNLYPITISDGNTSVLSFTVNASARYTAGQNSVNVTKTWEDNVCTCNPSAGTGAGKTITLTQTTQDPTTSAPNLYRVTVNDGSTQVMYFTVDASARYTAGRNSVSLTTGSFNTNGTKSPPTGYDGFSSITINVPTGYTGLTVSGSTVQASTSSSITSVTISVGNITVQSTNTPNRYYAYAPVKIDNSQIGNVSGTFDITSSGNKTVKASANVTVNGTTSEIASNERTDYYTYTPPTPPVTHNAVRAGWYTLWYGSGYPNLTKAGRANWYYSDTDNDYPPESKTIGQTWSPNYNMWYHEDDGGPSDYIRLGTHKYWFACTN